MRSSHIGQSIEAFLAMDVQRKSRLPAPVPRVHFRYISQFSGQLAFAGRAAPGGATDPGVMLLAIKREIGDD